MDARHRYDLDRYDEADGIERLRQALARQVHEPHPWAERIKTGLVIAGGSAILLAALVVAVVLAARQP